VTQEKGLELLSMAGCLSRRVVRR